MTGERHALAGGGCGAGGRLTRGHRSLRLPPLPVAPFGLHIPREAPRDEITRARRPIGVERQLDQCCARPERLGERLLAPLAARDALIRELELAQPRAATVLQAPRDGLDGGRQRAFVSRLRQVNVELA